MRAFALGGFVRPDDNLFGGGDRLARLLRLDAGGRRAGFLDQLLALAVGLGQDAQALRLDPGQLRLDLLGVGQAAGNLLAPRLENPQDRLVGEQVQDRAHDAEADDLRAEMGPVDAEGAGDLLDLSSCSRLRSASLEHTWSCTLFAW